MQCLRELQENSWHLVIPTTTTDSSTITIFLGKTPFSGIAQILVDGVAITDGDTALPGDTGGDKSGLDLYIPVMSTSNDIDLGLIDGDGSSQKNITSDDNRR